MSDVPAFARGRQQGDRRQADLIRSLRSVTFGCRQQCTKAGEMLTRRPSTVRRARLTERCSPSSTSRYCWRTSRDSVVACGRCTISTSAPLAWCSSTTFHLLDATAAIAIALHVARETSFTQWRLPRGQTPDLSCEGFDLERLTLPLPTGLTCAVEGAQICIDVASVSFGTETVSRCCSAVGGRALSCAVVRVVDGTVGTASRVSMMDVIRNEVEHVR